MSDGTGSAGVEFRPLTEADTEQLIDLRSVAYGPIKDREAHAEAMAWRLDHSLGAFYGGRLRSVSFMFPFEAYIGGARTTLGCLASVATGPEARRRGLVAAGLRRWFAELRTAGVGWSAEHPFEPTFYARLGYQTVPNGHTVVMTASELRASVASATSLDPAGTVSGSGVSGSGVVDAEPIGGGELERLKPIHDAFARRFSFDLGRTDGVKDHWGDVLRRHYESVDQHAYLLEDAYAIFTTEDEPGSDERSTLWVRDFAYSSALGRRGLFALLAGFEGQVDSVRIHLPPGDHVALDRAAYYTAKAPELQLRIVDLQAALGGLAWPLPAALRLRVIDPDCPWNDGVFEVELGEGGANVKRSEATAHDAALGVRALVSLITGVAPPESLIADGLAEGSADRLRPLSLALAGHPIFKPHADHF